MENIQKQINFGITENFKSIGNKLEWSVPEVLIKEETHFFTSTQKFYIKDKALTNHWVGPSKINPIDVDFFVHIKVIINELESSLNVDDTTESPVVTEVVQEDVSVNNERKKRHKIDS